MTNEEIDRMWEDAIRAESARIMAALVAAEEQILVNLTEEK